MDLHRDGRPAFRLDDLERASVGAFTLTAPLKPTAIRIGVDVRVAFS